MVRFRIWEKKRGERRTGSRTLGSIGEALFFSALLSLGCASLAYLVVSQLWDPHPQFFQPGLGYWLLVLVLGSFIVIGGGGLIFTVLQLGVSSERRAALAKRASGLEILSQTMASTPDYPTIPRGHNLTNSPGTSLAYRLPAMQSPAWQLLASGSFFVVWTGITVTLLTVAVSGHRSGNPDWPLTVAVLPVLGICGWASRYFFQQLRFQAGVGPTTVEVSRHPLYPGDQCDVFLSQTGRLSIRKLELLLVCEEHATYRQGTDIRTEIHRVFCQQLFRQERFRIEPGKSWEHRGCFTIPPTAMHSFQGSHNAVHWLIEVRCRSEVWGPFTRSFPILVYPHPPELVAEPAARPAPDVGVLPATDPSVVSMR